jgi:hypothetical protein
MDTQKSKSDNDLLSRFEALLDAFIDVTRANNVLFELIAEKGLLDDYLIRRAAQISRAESGKDKLYKL